MGTSHSTTPGAAASNSVARSTEIGRSNSALIDSECPVNTGTRTQVPRHEQVGNVEDLAALVAQLLFLVGLERAVVDDASPAYGNTLNAIGLANFSGVGERDRRTVVGELRRLVDDLATLLVEFVDAGEATAGDGLVGGRDDR